MALLREETVKCPQGSGLFPLTTRRDCALLQSAHLVTCLLNRGRAKVYQIR